MKMPSGDLFEASTYTHRPCASVLPAKCVALVNRTGQTKKKKTGQKRLKIFQLLNVSFKISVGIVLMCKKLFMSVLDTVVFENHRQQMLVPNKSLITSGVFLGSHLLTLLNDLRNNYL